MMQTWAIRIGLTLALVLVGFFGFAPGYVDYQRNVIDGEPLPEVSAEAQALHDTLTIVDLHGDTLLWDRDLLKPARQMARQFIIGLHGFLPAIAILTVY